MTMLNALNKFNHPDCTYLHIYICVNNVYNPKEKYYMIIYFTPSMLVPRSTTIRINWWATLDKPETKCYLIF